MNIITIELITQIVLQVKSIHLTIVTIKIVMGLILLVTIPITRNTILLMIMIMT